MNAEQLNPFVGLRPFDTGDHHWFFGRDREIAALLRKVRNNRFTAVVGASGSGKSSLVRAGVLVPLADDGWQTIIAKPGSAPIAKLAAALSQVARQHTVQPGSDSAGTTEDDLTGARRFRYDAQLRQSAYGLAEICRQLATDAPRLVLVIDQFEELFRYGEEAQTVEKAAMEEESRAFVELLLTAVAQAESRLHVILTMRSDFFGNCAAYNGLAEAVSASQYLVPLPRRDQMEVIIREPVARAGGRIDDALVQRLLLEVTEQLDHLPALQHTLRRLWEMAPKVSGQRQLRESDYQSIGGVAGSIDFKAEKIAAELKRAHAEDFITLERVMKAITDLDEQGRATRRPQKRSNLMALLTEVTNDEQLAKASLDRVLAALASEEISFVQLGEGDDPEVDIGHEALIRSWRKLNVLEFVFVADEGEKVNLGSSKDPGAKTSEKRTRAGWLAEEREDGQYWKELVRREKNKQSLHLTDAWYAHRWIEKKKIGAVWASRYGGVWQSVNQFIRKSLIKNGAIVFSILCVVIGVITIASGLAWMNYDKAQENYRKILLQESETLRQARAGALAAAGYARSFNEDGYSRLGVLVALRVLPESRNRGDPRYVEEVGVQLANGLVRPIEVMRMYHQRYVMSVAYSPDGSRIVSGGWDNTIRIWDAQSGQPVGEPLVGHDGNVYSVAYSPDGSRIVSGSGDNTIRIWNAQTGQPLGEPLAGHDGVVYSVAYSPDGSRIVSGSRDNTVRIWNAQTGQPLGEPLAGHDGDVYSVAYSPDGSRIVSGSGDNTIRIRDAQTGQPLGEPLAGHDGNVYSVAYSPDGSRIVSGSGDNTIRIWNAQSGQPLGAPLKEHDYFVLSVAYSPEGSRIVSGGVDNTVRIWDAQTGQPLGEPLKGHVGGVDSVAYSPDGSRIVSGSRDNTVRIWNVQTGQPLGEPLTGHDGDVASVAYSPDGSRIVSGGWDNTMRIWDAQSGQPLGEPLKGHVGGVTSVAYSPDGSRIVSGSSDRTVRIWDAQSSQPLGEPLAGHGGYVTSVAYSPDGSRIVSGGGDNTVRIWDAQTGQQVGEPLKGHDGYVDSVAYAPDGNRIVSGSRDNTVRIWNVQTGQPLGEPLTGHDGDVASVAYSPDGSRIVSGGRDNTVLIWDAQTGQPLGEPLKGHDDDVYSVAYSTNDSRISVAYSPDGSRIVSGGGDNTVHIWDAQTGQPLGEPLKGHVGGVTSVAYSPDGSRIVSGSSDRTVRIWDAGLFTASFNDLVEKAEKLCPLSLQERQQLRLIDLQVEAAQKPLTEGQRRACGSQD